MKNIKVVIGASFGDEGKGLITDYFASETKNGLVVRYNGGSQAGHTVVTPDGIRHVFSHFGSGTFLNLPTYLSEYFIINPMLFRKEYEKLQEKGFNPIVYVHPKCIVTTPFDMLTNQIIEKHRNNDKHGSCGVGIYETIKRNQFKEFQINLKNLFSPSCFKNKLQFIKEKYILDRLIQLGIDHVSLDYMNLIYNTNVIENYFRDVEFILNNTTFIPSNLSNSHFDSLIFEGAQGLLLDQNNKEYFPNLTPSNTGMQNVTKILKQNKLKNENIEICYVTRNYITRHGAGKLKYELPNKPYSKTVDLTNITNEYQGALRFGLLDINYLRSRIKKDLQFANGLDYKTSVAITCLDQTDDEIKYYKNGILLKQGADKFINDIIKELNIDKCYLSHGMTRNNISEYFF